MEYHKIQTIFKRDPETKFRTLLEGEYSLPEFEYLANNRWVFTEKVDGTNIRVHFKDGGFKFYGKTDKAQIFTPLLNKLIDKFQPQTERFIEKFGENADVCLYGEGYGTKIQSGGNYRSDQGFVLFDVAIDGLWLQRANIEDIAQSFGLDIVPIIGEGTLIEMVECARSGIKSTWGDFQAEGYVARPAVEMQTRRGERIITKIKCKDFHR